MFSKLVAILMFFNIALGSRMIIPREEAEMLRVIPADSESSSSSSSEDSRMKDEELIWRETTCGNPAIAPNAFDKIMGGEEAKPYSLPWQVSLQDFHGTSIKNFCGASILTATKMVSAAHCFFDKHTGEVNSITNLYAVAGIHHLLDSYSETKSQSKKVIRIVTHALYNPKKTSAGFDIALLYIAAPGFTFNAKVQPVCLPTSDVPDGTMCLTSGWGNLWEGHENGHKKLYQVKVPIVSQAKCFAWLGRVITSTTVCAGYAEGVKDSCQGDSGGPLVCKRDGVWVLDGIVSWGHGCGRPKNPGVYTRVNSYLRWIDSN